MPFKSGEAMLIRKALSSATTVLRSDASWNLTLKVHAFYKARQQVQCTYFLGSLTPGAPFAYLNMRE